MIKNELDWNEVFDSDELMDALAFSSWGDNVEEAKKDSKYVDLAKPVTVRILGNPIRKDKHFIKENGKTVVKGCMGVNCSHCKDGIKATANYEVDVIDRTDGKIKKLTGGVQIFNGIKAYAADEDWGDPREWDAKITFTGEGINKKYTVLASPKKSLTDEEKEAYKKYSQNDDWNTI